MKSYAIIGVLLSGLICAANTAVVPSNVQAFTLQQPVNHFGSAADLQWTQHFFVDNSVATTNGPIFVFIFGEEVDYVNYLQNSHMRELAEEMGAYVMALEPRYHGLSLPLGDLSTSNLEFLTIEQNIQDILKFVELIKTWSSQPNYSHKVILFGTDIGASYATWLRVNYPDAVDGVVAYGAPLHVEYDFPEYFDATLGTLEDETPLCAWIYLQAAFQIDDLVQAGESARLQELFNMEAPLDLTYKNDVSTFYWTLIDAFVVDYVYNNVDEMYMSCNAVLQIRQTPGITDLETVARRYLNLYPGPHSFTYADKVARYSSGALDVGRQRFYQSCSQAAWFHTSQYLEPPIDDYLLFSYYAQLCQDVFGSQFTPTSIRLSNEVTRLNYNIDDVANIDNIYFQYSFFDPYFIVGPRPTEDDNGDIIWTVNSVYLHQVGRFFGVWRNSPNDFADVTEVKSRTRNFVLSWLAN